MHFWVKQSVYSSLRLMHCCINKHNLASCLTWHSNLHFFLMVLILNCITGFGFCDTLSSLTALPGPIYSFAFLLFMECCLLGLCLGARSQKEAIHTCLAVQRHGYHELCPFWVSNFKMWEACTILFFFSTFYNWLPYRREGIYHTGLG